MPDVRALRIKIFADGADLEGMLALAQDPLICWVHHESNTDAPFRGYRLRHVCEGGARLRSRTIPFLSKSWPMSSKRCGVRHA